MASASSGTGYGGVLICKAEGVGIHSFSQVNRLLNGNQKSSTDQLSWTSSDKLAYFKEVEKLQSQDGDLF